MKMLLSFLAASLTVVSFISAVPNMNDCSCQNCTCNQENHCGCFSNSESPTSSQCKCGEKCKCGGNCPCN